MIDHEITYLPVPRQMNFWKSPTDTPSVAKSLRG